MSCRCHNNAAFVSTQLCYGQVDLAQAVMPGADFQTTQCYADWLTAGMLLLMSWQVCLCTLTIRCRASAFALVALSIKERKQHADWTGNLVTDSPTLLGRQPGYRLTNIAWQATWLWTHQHCLAGNTTTASMLTL